MEAREFKVHPKLLSDVIKRQAGSLHKAVLEGIMNSVDAKASVCNVTINSDRVIIEDDGQGFRNREEIENWFEVFGQPHEESEKKTYGSFRMGRGQMFAFGVNNWYSNNFKMYVDIDKNGLQYELSETPDSQNQEGCKIIIDLYNSLSRLDIATLYREIVKVAKYAAISLYINEEEVSVDPKTEKWDFETEDAYIRLNTNSELDVYHLGVYIRCYGSYLHGTGGTILAKKQLKLNFARNDILVDSCDVWARIKAVFKKKADEKIKKSPMNDSSRRKFARDFLYNYDLMDHKAFRDLTEKRIITSSNGRQYSIEQLSNFPSNFICSAAKGDAWGDRAMQQKLAFAVSNNTLDRFDCSSAEQFLEKICHVFRAYLSKNANYPGPYSLNVISLSLSKKEVISMSDIFSDMSINWTALNKNELTPNEKVWLRLIDSYEHSLRGFQVGWKSKRKFFIGTHPTADGWTDGKTYIGINREFLKGKEFSIENLVKVGNLVLHEYCHCSADSGTHTHSQEFYEKYHDESDAIGLFSKYCFNNLEKILKTENRRINKKVASLLDKAENTKDEIERHSINSISLAIAEKAANKK